MQSTALNKTIFWKIIVVGTQCIYYDFLKGNTCTLAPRAFSVQSAAKIDHSTKICMPNYFDKVTCHDQSEI